MLLAQEVESEPLPSHERPLDLGHLARQTAGDRKLEREVLAIFRRQARQMLFQLEALTDPHGRLELAHTLNGSAKGVGAWRVAAAAEQLETQARAGQASGEVVADLAESVSQVIGEIDELLLDR